MLAIGRLPGFRVDRTGAAIIGASLMIAFNVLTVDEAYAAINYDTIMLLFGMMIVVANLRLSGFFSAGQRVGGGACAPAAGPAGGDRRRLGRLLGVLRERHDVPGAHAAGARNHAPACGAIPCPTCSAVAMASNIGSVATITGNPQNMMIGSFSGIPYRDVRRGAGARWPRSGSC